MNKRKIIAYIIIPLILVAVWIITYPITAEIKENASRIYKPFPTIPLIDLGYSLWTAVCIRTSIAFAREKKENTKLSFNPYPLAAGLIVLGAFILFYIKVVLTVKDILPWTIIITCFLLSVEKKQIQ